MHAQGLGSGLLLLALLSSACVVRVAIAYARRRGLLDLPGQRRSHRVPTPRGGGIGIVLAACLTVPLALWRLPAAWPPAVCVALEAGLLAVALVGWVDDHRSLSVRPRLLVQLLACAGFSVAMLWHALPWGWLPLLVLAGGWSVNLHNFMDGIDGLLAQQALFVMTGLAVLAAFAGQAALACAGACVVMAVAGFWWFNRPPARIFMGDVGSGALGFLVFAFTALLWRTQAVLLWPALILSSAFVVDASLTLLLRILGGRRWHQAHREHLYQWLVRRGDSHALAGARYLGLNVLFLAPLAALAAMYDSCGFLLCVAVYGVTAIAWWLVKRRCLRRVRYRERRVHG